MYKVKENIDLSTLEKYGFKKGKDLPEYNDWICNSPEYEDYHLIPMNPDEPEHPFYSDEGNGLLIWSIHVQPSRRLWIQCVPSCTYEITNMDMDEMFYRLKQMIEDGILEDDYEII